jgi:hypothetical protein
MPTDTSDDGRLAYLTRVCGGRPTRRRFLAILPEVAGLYVSEAAAKRHGGRKRQGPTEGRAGTESRSQGVTIVLDRERDAAGNTRSAIFSATGAINDSGAFTVEGVHLGGIGAPTFGVVQTLNRLEGRHGTLMVRETHKVTKTGVADVFDIDGTWVVHSGTDDYSRLQGQGTATGEIIETAVRARFHFTLTGTVHSD